MGHSQPPKHPSQRRRTNAQPASAPDIRLPREGRKGPIPDPPVPLGPLGGSLWERLWRSPQATLWHDCHLDGVAKRCQIEDLWKDAVHTERLRMIAAVAAWEDRWGFNPKALQMMHMFIEATESDEPEYIGKPPPGVSDIRNRLKDVG